MGIKTKFRNFLSHHIRKTIPITVRMYSIIGLAITLFAFYLITARSFQDKNRDTTQVTNVGFAMAIALSSVCFSWYRTYDSKDSSKVAVTLLRDAGQDLIYTAIAFVSASASKYVVLHKEFFEGSWIWFRVACLRGFEVFYSFSFFIAFLYLEFSLVTILQFLYYYHRRFTLVGKGILEKINTQRSNDIISNEEVAEVEKTQDQAKEDLNV